MIPGSKAVSRSFCPVSEDRLCMQMTRRLRFSLCVGIAGLMLVAMPLGFDGSKLGLVRAWAGNGNGHGNGNGNAGGHGNGNANANGHDNDNQGADTDGQGDVNAAHAPDSALLNASPTSQVGKIAAYRDAELAAQTTASYAQAAIYEAQTALNQTVANAEADGTV